MKHYLSPTDKKQNKITFVSFFNLQSTTKHTFSMEFVSVIIKHSHIQGWQAASFFHQMFFILQKENMCMCLQTCHKQQSLGETSPEPELQARVLTQELMGSSQFNVCNVCTRPKKCNRKETKWHNYVT